MKKIPLAYLITFTCYGTWLHGDERGSVDDAHDVFDTPFVEQNETRNAYLRKSLKQPPLFLTETQRNNIAATIVEVCIFRGWTLHEQNVRTNHVHVVVSGDADPEKMSKDFKAYATRRLREAGELDKNRFVWTEGKSAKYLWTEKSLAAAVDYVRNQ